VNKDYKSHKRPRLSPLRYPGGKAALFPQLSHLIKLNLQENGTYVEPYAGGAGAALGLLVTGQVQNIVINDLDTAIFAFWRAVVADAKEFSMRIQNATLTVEEWERQKEIYVKRDTSDLMALGFATFYLNRTNRSGVLNGGPIGGKDQTGSYKIDARFNKQTLLERIRLINLYASHIDVRNQDGAEIIKEFAADPNALIYADPPYFEKGSSLYLNSFTQSDHLSLAEDLNEVAAKKWVLTYDNVSQVKALYQARRQHLFALDYSGHKVARVNEVMVYSDGLILS
jgi:DNA adenine methylase